MFGTLFRVGLLTTLVGGSAMALVGPERVKGWLVAGKDNVVAMIDEAEGMETKLKIIRKEIDGLDQESRRLREEAVRRRVEAERLRAEIEDRERDLEKRARVLEKASVLLAEAKPQYVIGRTVFTHEEVERDAADKLAIFTVQKETLENLKETLATKENAHDIAAENVARAAALRADLASKVQLLEARLQKYRAKEAFAATVDQVVDLKDLDSDLAQARQMIDDFERDLEVKARMLDERLAGGLEQPREGIDYEVLERGPQDVAARIRSVLQGSPVAEAAPAKAEPAVARAAR